ncbi:hypothetical protein [Mycobacterium sp. 1245801.1]|uniref:hypothetical protein n=1 Tax=Mycobacterium sp. 1245801.1 TaxID=1834075 RepID=UPI000ACE9142|nr:hypothetical protein [Mycobacterium sp. 1245801.1]
MASVRRVSEGRYKVLWREPVRDDYGCATGKFRQTSETIKRDGDREARIAAEQRADVIERELATTVTNPSDTKALADRPLGGYARDYFDSMRGLIAKRTVEGYEALYRVHVGPTLGNRPVGSIRVADVKRLRAELLTTNGIGRKSTRSPKTAAQVLGVLRRILDTNTPNQSTVPTFTSATLHRH